MRLKWVIGGLLVTAVVGGYLVFFTNSTVALANYVQGNFATISRLLALLFGALAAVRYLVLRWERQMGTLGGEPTRPMFLGDILGELGPTGSLVADALSAWIASTTGLAILSASFSGRLLEAAPGLTLEGLVTIDVLMLVLLGLSGLLMYQISRGILYSPVMQRSLDDLTKSGGTKSVVGNIEAVEQPPPPGL